MIEAVVRKRHYAPEVLQLGCTSVISYILLFTQVPRIGILRSSPFGYSRKFGLEKRPERHVYAPALKLHYASYFRTGTYLGTGHTRTPCSLPRTYCRCVAPWVRLLLAPIPTLGSKLRDFHCHEPVFVECVAQQGMEPGVRELPLANDGAGALLRSCYWEPS